MDNSASNDLLQAKCSPELGGLGDEIDGAEIDNVECLGNTSSR